MLAPITLLVTPDNVEVLRADATDEREPCGHDMPVLLHWSRQTRSRPHRVPDQTVFVIPTLKQRRANPGQVIVLPRAHVVGLHRADPALLTELFTVVARITAAAPAAFDAVGSTTFNNNNTPDQGLAHLHVHVVPRHHDDAFVIPNPEHDIAPHSHRADIAERLRHALRQQAS